MPAPFSRIVFFDPPLLCVHIANSDAYI